MSQTSLTLPQLAQRVWPYVRPHRRDMVCVMGLSLVPEAFWLSAPLISQRLVDGVLAGDATTLPRLLPILFTLAPLATLAFWLGRRAEARLINRATEALRNDLVAHIQRLPLSRIEAENSGDLLMRVNSGTDTLSGLLGDLFRQWEQATSFVAATAILLVLSWPMLVLALLLIAISAAWTNRALSTTEALSHQRNEMYGEGSGMVQDALGGIAAVKAYNAQPIILGRYQALHTRILALTQRLERARGISNSLQHVLSFVPRFAIPIAGALLAINGQLSVGGVVATAALASSVSVQGFFYAWASFKQNKPVLERALVILDMPTEQAGRALPTPTPLAELPLALEDIAFRYAADREPVLRGISLSVPAGKTVALVGASGGGKSSVVKLICGFYTPDAGRIYIYGQPLHELDLDSARQVIALVSQETYVYPCSIAENIAYGLPNATFEQVVSAAQAANAHAFILEQPEGYQTRVGERGVLLSGGQRQRVALARAILKDAPILLLDEPTASLDTESERLIQDALARFSHSRATLVIAHRLSTIRDADEIIVLEAGLVAERGTHAQLMAVGGAYYRLVAQQLEVSAS